VIDGKAIAAALKDRIAKAVTELPFTPGLAVVIVGNDPASEIYVRNKARTAEACGFHSVRHHLPDTVSEQELLAVVQRLNDDPAVHGILVQLPLPAHIDPGKVIEAIDPAKDVDGFHSLNVGRLATGLTGRALLPCTPLGCLYLIQSVRGTDLTGLEATMIGCSTIVGRPMIQLLLQENCTVHVAHKHSRDCAALARQADILVVATGCPGLVRGDWIKPGATVIDVGINRIEGPDGKPKLTGDVVFDEAMQVAGAVTPVPGGVGPMTIAMLMRNTLQAACRHTGHPMPEV